MIDRAKVQSITAQGAIKAFRSNGELYCQLGDCRV